MPSENNSTTTSVFIFCFQQSVTENLMYCCKFLSNFWRFSPHIRNNFVRKHDNNLATSQSIVFPFFSPLLRSTVAVPVWLLQLALLFYSGRFVLHILFYPFCQNVIAHLLSVRLFLLNWKIVGLFSTLSFLILWRFIPDCFFIT